jgi:hypothetical protein
MTSSTAHRTRELGVRDARGKAYALRARQPDRRYDLHVEVARRRVKVAERARTEQPGAHQPVTQRIA